MARWSFVTHHGLVFAYLARHPRSTVREVANAVGLTERTVQRIITDLVEAGYLNRRRQGRRNIYRVRPRFLPSDASEREIAVEALMEALTRGRWVALPAERASQRELALRW